VASPQTENGYLKIAMEIIEALARHRIPGQEMQLIWVLLRKTWGWGKKSDDIPLSQWARLTGIKRTKCCTLLNSLVAKNIVKKSSPQKGTGNANIYGFNKDFETWKSSPQKGTPSPQKGNKAVPKRVINSVPKKGLSIDTTIDTNQYILSQLLLSLILKRRNTFKKPNLQAWAKHIELMIRVDKRDPKEIEELIRWCQQDTFWQNNILSTAKLRKQYDRLALQMEENQETDYKAQAQRFIERHKNDKKED